MLELKGKYCKDCMIFTDQKQEAVTNGYLVGEAMKGYVTDMVVAQVYAEYNHLVIDKLVMEVRPVPRNGAF